MKKKFICPSTICVNIQLSTMLCGSNGDDKLNTNGGGAKQGGSRAPQRVGGLYI